MRIKNPGDRKKEAAERERARADAEDQRGQRPTAAEDYELPSLELLLPSDDVNFEAQEKEVRRKAKILEKTFLDFGFNVRVVEIETGPVITQFEVELEAGLRLSKITGLADDLAIALRVPSVRIVAPIPGKNTVGIEVPNDAAADRPARRGDRRGQRQSSRRCGSRSSWARTSSGNAAGLRPGRRAPPADRRPHRHGQERLPERDHLVDPDDARGPTKCGCS